MPYNPPRIDVERLSSVNHIKSLPRLKECVIRNPRACFKYHDNVTFYHVLIMVKKNALWNGFKLVRFSQRAKMEMYS